MLDSTVSGERTDTFLWEKRAQSIEI
jgi:hypothetical protein